MKVVNVSISFRNVLWIHTMPYFCQQSFSKVNMNFSNTINLCIYEPFIVWHGENRIPNQWKSNGLWNWRLSLLKKFFNQLSQMCMSIAEIALNEKKTRPKKTFLLNFIKVRYQKKKCDEHCLDRMAGKRLILTNIFKNKIYYWFGNVAFRYRSC